MARKKKNAKDSAENFAKEVRESAHKIWLAGLGAFDSARDGSGKLFDKMVKQGRKVEDRTAPKIKETAHDVGEALRKEARNLEEQLKKLVNKMDSWRSSPPRKAAPKKKAKSKARSKKKASRKQPARKKAPARKRAAAKKKAARKKKTSR